MPANHRVLNELLGLFGPKLVCDHLVTMSNRVLDNGRPNLETNLAFANFPLIKLAILQMLLN